MTAKLLKTISKDVTHTIRKDKTKRKLSEKKITKSSPKTSGKEKKLTSEPSPSYMNDDEDEEYIGKIYGLERIPGRKFPYEVVTHDIVKEVDVCVIGSGAGGAILANKLAVEGKKKVVLIEKGGYYDREDLNERELYMMRLLWKNSGLNFTDNGRTIVAQAETLGGSTVINDAICFEIPKSVSQDWRDNYHVNISDNEWKAAIREVKDNINVVEMKESELNTNALKLKKACQDNNYEFVHNKRNCIESKGCGFCHLGCHYDRKQDMLITYIRRALRDSELEVYCNCAIEKIIHEDGKVTGVEGNFQMKDGFPLFQIRINAKVVIVSAGAIASSRLLLRNNIALGQAGQRLAIHPAALMVGKFDERIEASKGIPMPFSCTEFSVENEDDPPDDGGFMLESIFIPPYQMSLQLPISSAVNYMLDYNYYTMAGVMVKDKSSGNIQLGNLGGAKIHYELSQGDKNIMARGSGVLANLWFDAGAKKVITGHSSIPVLKSRDDIGILESFIATDIENYKYGSAHPQGGNCMGKDEFTSVVDSNCKVHGINNLFVCDASVFPTSLGVNPQLTVMSLATITADRIIKNWDSKFENIKPKKSLGPTCDISQPRFCNEERLDTMYYQQESKNNLFDVLLNADDINSEDAWSLDENKVTITNNKHWRGFSPDLKLSDPNAAKTDSFDYFANTIQDSFEQKVNLKIDYIAGFWKRFTKEGNTTKGKVHAYALGKNSPDIPLVAEIADFNDDETNENFKKVYGDLIHLKYDVLGDLVYDFLKIIDENTILGKTYLGIAPFMGKQVFSFVLTKKYPVEDMDLDDHKHIFEDDKYSSNIEFNEIIGRWDVRIFKNDLLTPIVYEAPNIKFVFFEKNYPEPKKIVELKNIILIKLQNLDPSENYLGKEDAGGWSSSIRKVNDRFLVGRLTSPTLNSLSETETKDLENFIVEENGEKHIVIPYALSF